MVQSNDIGEVQSPPRLQYQAAFTEYNSRYPVCTDTDRVTMGRAGIAMIDLVSIDAVTLRRPVISTIGAQPYSAVVHVPQLGSVVRADRHLMHMVCTFSHQLVLLCPVGSAVGGLPNVMGNEPEGHRDW